MSSLVNKSGVRFAPKIKQRRSVTSTPVVSRRPSVAPSIDSELKRRDFEDAENNSDSDNDHDSDNNNDDDNDDFGKLIVPSDVIERRMSSSGPQETKQRRLSTLSNTSRSDLSFRKNSISESTPLVISQPERTSTKPSARNRQRKTTEDKNASKPTINILTPPSTQQESFDKSAIEFSRSFTDNAAANNLVTPVSSQLPKSQGKENINGDGDPKSANPLLSDHNDITSNPQSEFESQNGNVTSLTPPSSADSFNSDSTKEYLIYDEKLHKIRKVTANQGLTSDNIVKTYNLKDYDELKHLKNTLDPSLTQDLHLEESTFKMADLCKPSLPIGKVSANFELAQRALKSKRMQRVERRNARERARKERRSLESYEDIVKEETKKPIKAEDLLSLEAQNATSAAQQSVQLKLDQDGNIIVDEESRVVDRHANVDVSGLERHDENPFENLVNSATYGKQRYSDKWDNNERELLYQGLYQWGTDFGLIAQMFPYRTRRQIKSKFILEEKKNPHLVELALSRKLNLAKFNLDKYSESSNKTFDDLEKFNDKILELQRDHQENLKELSAARDRAKEEDSQKQKRQERDIRDGWDQKPKTRKERMTELRKHETVLGSIDDIKRQREEEQAEA